MNSLLMNTNNRQFIQIAMAVTLAMVVGVFAALPLVYLPIIILIIAVIFFFPLSVERIFTFIALSIFIDRSFITFQGSYIRIFQILFLALFLKFAIEYLLSRREIVHAPLFILINLWVFSYFFSIGHLISVGDFWESVVGQLFLNLFYFISVQCIYSKGLSYFDKILKYTIISGVIVTFVGILQWIGFFFGFEFGLSHYEEIGIPRPSSFAHEPDWYGLFAGYSAVWFVVMYLRKDSRLFSQLFILIGMFMCFVGVFISMARASILSLIVAILFILIITKNMRAIKLLASSAIIMIVGAMVLFIINQDIFMKVYDRFNPSTSLETDQGAADSRFASIQLMLDYIPKHPLVGNGSGGMSELSMRDDIRQEYIYGGELNAGKGNANIFLTVLFDTGIIGLIIFLLILGRAAWMILSVYHKSNFIPLGFLAASIFILVDFNFNNGFRMGFVWFHAALIASYFLLIRKEKRRLNTIPGGELDR